MTDQDEIINDWIAENRHGVLKEFPAEEYGSVACPDCGDPEGRNEYDYSCKNHAEYVLCECGTFYPLVQGTFSAGTPDRGPSFSSGGEPGDPPEFYCPGKCIDDDVSSEPRPLTALISETEAILPEHGRAMQEAYRAFLKCKLEPRLFAEAMATFGFEIKEAYGPWSEQMFKPREERPEDRLLVCEDCGRAYDPKHPRSRTKRPGGLYGCFCGPCIEGRNADEDHEKIMETILREAKP